MKMTNNDLLGKELRKYKHEYRLPLKPLLFKKSVFPRLFKKFKFFGMTVKSYCCDGLENCCWQEVVEEGVWNLPLQQVKDNIMRNLKHSKKYLYNYNKNNKRLYKYEDNTYCLIYIYLRDILEVDYAIWFANKDR